MSLLHHRVAGNPNGDTVLLLNGGLMSLGTWAPVMAPLEADYQFLSCDFRGQLFSPGPAHERLEGNLGDLIALLDAVGVERVHAVGTSFGGEVGLLLAAHHPDRVASLVAIAVVDHPPAALRALSSATRTLVAPILDGASTAPFAAHLIESVYAPAYRERMASELSTRQRQMAQLPTAWYRELLRLVDAVDSCDLRAVLPSIVCPTLIIAAAADALMPVAAVEAVASAIAGASFEVHPHAGHALLVEEPDWLAARLGAFLELHRGVG